ncbi:MAG: protein kinase [Sandaracinaceae bacterium]|nr:protein kinase [Sandaracinaceae bacterium]
MQGTRVTFEPETVLLGKLRIVRLIGRGAMGAVYEVEHLLTKHHRALKVLHRDLLGSGSAVARLIREAGVAGTLGSDRVVSTFDVGQLESGSPYVLMELLRGRTLADQLAAGPLSPSHAVHVAREIAAGMEQAHAHGIVHRDLKPANVFLAEDDAGQVHVKILDFGISKFTATDEGMQAALTVEGVVLGTPHYMSPEQAGAQADVDHRADVYALGVILYECLTGRRPYHADTFPALMAQIHLGDFTPLDTLPMGIDARLAAIVHRAIHPDRDVRIQTMAALSAELEPFDRFDPSETLLDASHGARATDPPTIAADHLVPPPVPARRPPPPPGPRFPGWALVGGGVAAGAGLLAIAWVSLEPSEPPARPAPTLAPALARVETDAASPPAPDAGSPTPVDGGPAEVDPEPPSPGGRRSFRHARQSGLRTDNPYGAP